MARIRPLLQLRARIILLVCAIVVVVLVVTGILVARGMERRALATLTEKAVMVSQMTAESEVVVGGLRGRRPPAAVQAFAERVRERSQVDFVVVLNMNRIRLSHPDPAQIGAQSVGGGGRPGRLAAGLGEALAHDVITILGNLLENVVEALRDSPLREVDIHLGQEEGCLEIVVADTGPGIAPELLPSLFDKGTSTKGERHGYGLWQAVRGAEAHGGRLTAGARPGGGAVFTALLPTGKEDA